MYCPLALYVNCCWLNWLVHALFSIAKDIPFSCASISIALGRTGSEYRTGGDAVRLSQNGRIPKRSVATATGRTFILYRGSMAPHVTGAERKVYRERI